MTEHTTIPAKRPILKEWLGFLCFLVAMVAFIALSSALLIPHRTNYGSTWGAFLQEPEDSYSAIFFGSSIAYCNVIPAVIYEESGIASYVMAGPEQTLPMTYYYVKEMFRTQSPDVVLVEVTGAYYPRYTNYNKINVGYMPWSVNRLGATFFAAEEELRTGLLFPLYNYHDLWSAPQFENLNYKTDDFAGYTVLALSREMESLLIRSVEFDESIFAENLASLTKIADLCREQGSRAVFFIAPTYHPWESDYISLLASKIAGMDGVDFVDFNGILGELDIDPSVDFYDLLHFNVYGAEKYSKYMAGFLTGYVTEPRTIDTAMWDRRVEAIHAVLDARES